MATSEGISVLLDDFGGDLITLLFEEKELPEFS